MQMQSNNSAFLSVLPCRNERCNVAEMPQSPTIPQVTKEQAKELFMLGMNMAEIGTRLSLKPSTVRQLASRGRWKTERKNARAEGRAKIELGNEAVAQAFSTRILKEFDRLLDKLEETNPSKVRDIKDAVAALGGIHMGVRKAFGLDDESGSRSLTLNVIMSPANAARPALDVASTTEVIDQPTESSEAPVVQDVNPGDPIPERSTED